MQITPELEEELVAMAGAEDSQYEVKEVSVAELKDMRTACGLSNPLTRPFTDNIVKHLEDSNVDTAVVLLLTDEDYPPIASMAARMNMDAAEEFSDMLQDTGGSLRPDETSTLPGWILFESE